MTRINLTKGLSTKEIITILTVLISGILFVVYIRLQTINQQKEEVMQIALTAEASIPKDEIQSLPEKPEDLRLQNFHQIKESLQQIICTNNNARFAYLYLERNDQLYFIADSEPESSPTYSPPGQAFSEADAIDKLPFKNSKALITPPVSDRWGSWMSVEVPVIDPKTGKVIAVFGMDYDAKSWQSKILFRVIESGVLVLFMLILVLVAIRSLQKNEKLKKEISLREIAEKGLKESESEYRLLFEINPQLLLVYDLESMKILTVNQAVIDKYGYTKEEFLEMSIIDLKAPEEFIRLWKNLIEDKHSLQRREIWNHRLKDGKIIQVEVNSHNFDFRHKDARLVLLIDITEILKSKKKLNLSERQINSLLSNLPGIVYRCALDKDYTMDFISEACTQITGYSPEEFLLNKTITFNNLILPEYREKIWQRWTKVIEDKSVFEEEYQIRTATGEIKWLWERGAGVFNENGKLLHLEGYLEDITTSKLAEEKHRQSEANLTRTIEESPFGIRILSPEGTTLYANTTLLWIFGFKSLNDFNLIPVSKWYTPESYTAYLDREARRKNNEEIELDYEVSIVNRESEIKHLLIHRKQIIWNGKLNEQVIYQDITDKKQSEAELIRAKEKAEESDRLKSAFLANISHEIRTPMNGILGFVDLLKTPELSTENQQEFIEVIDQCAERLLVVIDDLIDISSIEAGDISLRVNDVNLNKLIVDLYWQFKPNFSSKNLSFSYCTGLPDEDCIVQTDRDRLNQILTNLIRNGLKFTDEGRVEFGYSAYDSTLLFFVKDTGIGISEEKKEIIFERFMQGSMSYNRDYEGAGLGLTISKAFVELFGGKIWLDSELNKGTTFWFDIPLNLSQPNKNSASPELIRLPNQNIQVLVAEDDRNSRHIIKRMLEKSVENIFFANNGQEAVDMVRLYPAINLVLMDLKMPVMDGYEATRQIKELRPELTIIAQSAFIFPEDKDKALAVGCSHFLAKPIRLETLLGILTEVV